MLADEELTHVAMVVKVGLAATQDRAPDHLLLSQWDLMASISIASTTFHHCTEHL